MKRSIVTAALVLTLGAACSSKLDEQTARSVLSAREAGSKREMCWWGGARVAARDLGSQPPPANTKFDYNFNDSGDDHACAEQLERAGLATRGKCVEEGCGGCCKRLITEQGGAELKAALGGLRFACGRWEVSKIESIVTEERRSTVKYERALSFDEGLVGKLDKCKLGKPAKSASETLSASFVRTDDGKWTLQ